MPGRHFTAFLHCHACGHIRMLCQNPRSKKCAVILHDSRYNQDQAAGKDGQISHGHSFYDRKVCLFPPGEKMPQGIKFCAAVIQIHIKPVLSCIQWQINKNSASKQDGKEQGGA